uniref:BPTI/Kunitz inhibitor domain-containing protein n=1 Tax=Steinernema glaseri TaxID=37863 RepID=A0A1I8ASI8_9BILA
MTGQCGQSLNPIRLPFYAWPWLISPCQDERKYEAFGIPRCGTLKKEKQRQCYKASCIMSRQRVTISISTVMNIHDDYPQSLIVYVTSNQSLTIKRQRTYLTPMLL